MRSCRAVAVIRGNTWPVRQEEWFSTALLYYTYVKFNQEKNQAGIRGEATRHQAACAPDGGRYHPFN
jgi:hypothetical protein